MTIEEKKKELQAMCDQTFSCRGCSLYRVVEDDCDFQNMTEEETNMAYNAAFPSADNGTNNGIDAKDEHLAIVAEIIAKECDKAVANYKAALLKKIFPYDAVDKKQYSINAYAVWQAINETEVHHD